MSETPYDGNADVRINTPAGDAMEMIVNQVKSKLKKDAG